MSEAQSAILAGGGRFGLFLTALVSEGEAAAARVRRVAAALPALTRVTADRLGEPSLVSSLAFGAAVWPRLFPQPKPLGLVPFEPVADGPRRAPATPADLFTHLHADRHDVNFALARTLMADLGPAVRLVEEINGFQYLGGRDLTGFVDGTENPSGDERAGAALVGDEDPAFAAGSHVSIQRYVHNLERWEALALAEQEAAIGRSRDDDRELEGAAKPPSAHIARVVIEEDGAELEILRHSLPYGTTREHGLYFVAYCRSPRPFRRMLERMVRRDGDGHADRLLDFTTPVTGAAFFAPSADFLRALV
ncbi:MAG: Dyp-type peroxidase [Rhodospirillaceae bacterium]